MHWSARLQSTAFLTVLVALTSGVSAWAQQPPAAPQPAASPKLETATPLPEVEKASEIADSDKLARSSKALVSMRDALREVLSKLEEARRARDMVKLNCVNEKLTQVKGLLRIAEQADVALQEAVARREATAAEHEYTKVAIARQKVGQLRTETEACMGELAFRTDENLLVEVEEPGDLPKEDPSNPKQPLPSTISPPPASVGSYRPPSP